MTTFTVVPNTAVQPGGRPRGSTITALRDNLLAALEGDPTAIAAGIVLRDAALGLTPTTAGRDWVVARMLLAGAGGVGSYLLLSNQNTPGVLTGIEVGATVAGSSLLTVRMATGATNTPQTGTWMTMARHETGPSGAPAPTDTRRIGIFQRIS